MLMQVEGRIDPLGIEEDRVGRKEACVGPFDMFLLTAGKLFMPSDTLFLRSRCEINKLSL
jgi:hypothetical protein